MGIANKIINILVLIAAIGAAVCAFLLWQKREQITRGREMLSEAIVQAVDKIGPKGQIKKDSMSIKLEADQLKDPIAALQKNIDKICKQRDEIAKAFAEVVNSVNSLSSSMETKAQLETADLTDYDKYGAKCQESVALVTERVSYYKQRSEIMRSGLKELSAALKLAGISDKNFWNNEALQKDLSARTKRAKEFADRFQKYSGHIVTATDKLRKAIAEDAKLKKPALGLDSKNWQKELTGNMEGITTVANKIVAFRDAVKKLRTENEELKKQLSEKDALLKKKDKEIASLNKSLTDAKAEIKRLKKIIDPSSDEEDGTAGEAVQKMDHVAVKKLIGKITYVNPTYGFVAIDLGLKSTIKAVGVDGKPVNRIVSLPANAIMTVATSLDPADAKYVARIVVARVGTESSIANVLPLPGSTSPKVGDIVFFSDSDLRQMREIQELEMKQKQDEAARAKAAAASSADADKEVKTSGDGEEKGEEEKSGKSEKGDKADASKSDDDE